MYPSEIAAEWAAEDAAGSRAWAREVWKAVEEYRRAGRLFDREPGLFVTTKRLLEARRNVRDLLGLEDEDE